MIEESGPRPGLTDRVERFLLATTPTGPTAPGPDVRVVPHDDGPPAEPGDETSDEETGTLGPEDE
jgi:hypothetical protein